MKTRIFILAFTIFASSLLSLFPSVAIADSVATVKLSSIHGDVLVKKGGGLREYPAADGMTLSQGDWLRTGAKGSVILEFSNKTQTTIGANSELIIENLTNANSNTVSRENLKTISTGYLWEKISIKLWAGSVWNRVATLLNINDQFEVETPTAIMGVHGTLYLVKVDSNDGSTSGDVFEGLVAISQNKEQSEGGQQRMVSMGQQLQVNASAPSEQKAIDQKALIESTDSKLLVQVITDVITRTQDLMQRAKDAQTNFQQSQDLTQISIALEFATKSAELANFAKDFVTEIGTSTKLDEIKEVLTQNNQTLEQIQTILDAVKTETNHTQNQVISTAKDAGLSLDQIEEIVDNPELTNPQTPKNEPTSTGNIEGDNNSNRITAPVLTQVTLYNGDIVSFSEKAASMTVPIGYNAIPTSVTVTGNVYQEPVTVYLSGSTNTNIIPSTAIGTLDYECEGVWYFTPKDQYLSYLRSLPQGSFKLTATVKSGLDKNVMQTYTLNIKVAQVPPILTQVTLYNSDIVSFSGTAASKTVLEGYNAIPESVTVTGNVDNEPVTVYLSSPTNSIPSTAIGTLDYEYEGVWYFTPYEGQYQYLSYLSSLPQGSSTLTATFKSGLDTTVTQTYTLDLNAVTITTNPASLHEGFNIIPKLTIHGTNLGSATGLTFFNEYYTKYIRKNESSNQNQIVVILPNNPTDETRVPPGTYNVIINGLEGGNQTLANGLTIEAAPSGDDSVKQAYVLSGNTNVHEHSVHREDENRIYTFPKHQETGII